MTGEQPVAARPAPVQAEIHLQPRPGDDIIDAKELEQFEPFRKLKYPVGRQPGSIVLRRYLANDILVELGDAGGTAFYIPTVEDLARLAALKTGQALPSESDTSTEPRPKRQILTAAIPCSETRAKPRSFLQRWLSPATAAKARAPLAIPNDGPTDINYQTREAPLIEGDFFGEMSCISYVPRSARVFANHDCRVLEFTRSVFDALREDATYQDRVDKEYKRRTLDTHLRQLELFRDLSDAQIETLKSQAALELVRAGNIICEQGDPWSDAHPLDVFIVRNGVVQVTVNAPLDVRLHDIRDWPELCRKLDESQPGPAAPIPAADTLPPTAAAKSPLAAARPKPPAVEKPTGSPEFLVKSWLNEGAAQAIQQICAGTLPADSRPAALELILGAINELARNKGFLSEKRLAAEIYSKPELLRKSATFPKGIKGIDKHWSELELRTFGRAVLSAIFPDVIDQPLKSQGPPRVLAYLSRGDCFGEMAVVAREPRNATCIAYTHPSSEVARDFGHVELVRIPGSAFQRLLAESSELKSRVEALARERQLRTQAVDSPGAETDLVSSAEFQQMGLFQGNRLLVIDLNSCTRCGDCVQACVDTHDDGHTRLFLDGPRYDRFLVPSACRNCLNPVCMIGCPVGSIGRGENGQIEIEDWCIGCSLCANQCPYDSIQMHDMGLIAEELPNWQYAGQESLSDGWYKQYQLRGGWNSGEAPFCWTGDFLRDWAPRLGTSAEAEPLRMGFRHQFQVPRHAKPRRYRLTIKSPAERSPSKVAAIWLNGTPLNWAGKPLDLETKQLRPGLNLLAIELALKPPATYGQPFFSVRLDAIPDAGEQTAAVLGKDVLPEMRMVTHRAVVCDLCSHIPSQQPACVTSCPHDAAIRVNPLRNFPT